MERLLRISERTNMIIHVLAYMAESGAGINLSVKKLAEELNVSETYLAKVLQPVAKSGLIISTRGARGGFVLKRDPKEITMLELFIAAEGPLPRNGCLFGIPICKKKICSFSALNNELLEVIEKRLGAMTLAEVAESFKKEVC